MEVERSNLKEELESIKDAIRQENNLLDRRLSWLGTFEGFLFAAYAITCSSFSIALILSALGFLIAVSAGIGTGRATKAIKALEAYFDEIVPDKHRSVAVVGYTKPSAFAWLMPHRFFPFVVAVGWATIFAVKLLNL